MKNTFLVVIAVAFTFSLLPYAYGAGEEVTVVATEVVVQQGLMGLAGIVVAGLFWFGVIKNI